MKETEPDAGMSLIVKTVTCWIKAFILLFGVYVVLYGHLTPGGGFAGGVVVACAFILLFLAEGEKGAAGTLKIGMASALDSVGALIFLSVALMGLLFGRVFFKNLIETSEKARHTLCSGGLIPLSNIGIGLKVGMSLFLVFTLLSALHIAIKNGDRRMVRRGKE